MTRRPTPSETSRVELGELTHDEVFLVRLLRAKDHELEDHRFLANLVGHVRVFDSGRNGSARELRALRGVLEHVVSTLRFGRESQWARAAKALSTFEADSDRAENGRLRAKVLERLLFVAPSWRFRKLECYDMADERVVRLVNQDERTLRLRDFSHLPPERRAPEIPGYTEAMAAGVIRSLGNIDERFYSLPVSFVIETLDEVIPLATDLFDVAKEPPRGVCRGAAMLSCRVGAFGDEQTDKDRENRNEKGPYHRIAAAYENARDRYEVRSPWDSQDEEEAPDSGVERNSNT